MEKNTYYEIIKWLETHDGNLPRSSIYRSVKNNNRRETTKEERKEINLRKRWHRTKEYSILEQYEGKTLEEVPEEYREKIQKLRSLIKTEKRSDKIFEQVIRWLESHDGKLPRAAIYIDGKALKKDEMTEAQRAEINLYQRWQRIEEHTLLKKYKGKALEEVPEEYREKIQKLRRLIKTKERTTTTFEDIIEWLKTHDGQMPRSTISKKNKDTPAKDLTPEERYERNLNSRWRSSKLCKTLKQYEGKTLEEVPEEYKEKLRMLREFTKEKIKVFEYKEEQLTLKGIAKKEGISEYLMYKFFHQYNDVNKAVLLAKTRQTKSKKVKIVGSDISLYDLSLILGKKYSELLNALNRGMTIEEIKQSIPKVSRKKQITPKVTRLENGQSLLEYCIENKLNYSCIYRAINTYGKSLEEAIKSYKKEGQNIPAHWIFEKYGILLKHFMLNNNINIDKIVRYMRTDMLSMSEALEKYIIRSNAKKCRLQEEWIEEVYYLLTDDNISDEYDSFKQEFYITDDEENCVARSCSQFKNLDRKLLLFEIIEVLKENTLTQVEEKQLLNIYEVSKGEIEETFLELYSSYDDKILLGKYSEEEKRRKQINDIIRKWNELGQDEKEDLVQRRQISDEELKMIEDLSSKITKYKNMVDKDQKTIELMKERANGNLISNNQIRQKNNKPDEQER